MLGLQSAYLGLEFSLEREPDLDSGDTARNALPVALEPLQP